MNRTSEQAADARDPSPESNLPPALIPLFKALGDEQRIKVLASLIDRPMTLQQLVATLDTPLADMTRQLTVLVEAGLLGLDVDGAQPRYRFERSTLLQAMSRLPRPTHLEETADGLAATEHQVLANYFEEGRLTTIPAQPKKRDILLRFLAQRIDPGRTYSEKEVNMLLRQYHEDVASLRRYLVDGGFLRREKGEYRLVNRPDAAG